MIFLRVRKILRRDFKLRHTSLSAWNNSAPTGRIFMKFGIGVFFGSLSRKFKFHYNLTRMTGTLHKVKIYIFNNILLNSS
jgi:hypothetical protein